MDKSYVADNLRVFVVPVDILTADLTAPEKMVYIVLRSFCNPHKPEAFPAIDKIAELGSLSRSTVIRAVKSLEAKGYIIKENRYQYDPKSKKARQTSNLYRLHLPHQGGCHCDTGDGSHCDTGGVSHGHGGGVTVTHEQNHLTKSFNYEEESESDYDRLGRFVFGKSDYNPTEAWFIQYALDMDWTPEMAKKIAHASRVSDVSKAALHRTIDQLKDRAHQIGNLAAWFAVTLHNQEALAGTLAAVEAGL